MPLEDFAPVALTHQISVGSEPILIRINVKGDSVSLVCGNGDGVSFCGSTGSSDLTTTNFFDAKSGVPVTLPHSVFADWDGEYLTLQATEMSQLGENSLEMRIGLQYYS